MAAKQPSPTSGDLPRRLPPDFLSRLTTSVIGHPTALEEIGAIFEQWEVGLEPQGRPAGIFLLMGGTGTGKTVTVETIAEILFGNRQHILKVDCGEFQHSHEIAKLTGSPPGYLGFRETHPALSQQIVDKYQTPETKLSLVLFDEIEKASDSLWNLLLGILDKGTLTLGDNSRVNFSQSMVFMTSNLGSREMAEKLDPHFGFQSDATLAAPEASIDMKVMEAITLAAMKRRFTPEFVNRIDSVLTYRPFTREELRLIFARAVDEVQGRVFAAFGEGSFVLRVSDEVREWVLDQGEVRLYGARKVKRLVDRHVTRKLVVALKGASLRRSREVSVVLDQGVTRVLAG